MLSVERALGGATVLSINYVGTQAHRLPVLIEKIIPGIRHCVYS